MTRLGIERSNGLVYEGRGSPSHLVMPTPVVSQATLIESASDFTKVPLGLDSHPFTWMFREESFDPVSRVRRGRLFQKFGSHAWEQILVDAHPAIQSDLSAARSNGKVSKELGVYIECAELLSKPRRGEGSRLAIGVADAYSLWRIIQTERTASLGIMVTLRAESAFDILPELNKAQVGPDHLAVVQAAIERVLDAAYRELPTSVVDQCRNACTVLASRWLCQTSGNRALLKEDLGSCIKAVQQLAEPRVALSGTLQIIRTLHPRGKDNEAHARGLRAVSEEDAQMAVHLVGFVMREIGWGSH